jgi:SAM-dependent methyltransferase
VKVDMESTARFSDRVEAYRKYRPGYPPEVLDILARECGLGPDSAVADIGAGTGIFTGLLLESGAAVTGVEPNGPMREAMAAGLSRYPRFQTVDGSAEATGLASSSFDGATVAQAFHWFDRAKAKAEFSRILKPGGWCALIWNDRLTGEGGFPDAYDLLLRTHVEEYEKTRMHNVFPAGHIEAFFAPGAVSRFELDNSRTVDLQTLIGRFLSSSYAPKPGHPKFELVLGELEELFRRHAGAGGLRFGYTTRIFLGRFGGPADGAPG